MARGANQFGPYGTGKSKQARGAKKSGGVKLQSWSESAKRGSITRLSKPGQIKLKRPL